MMGSRDPQSLAQALAELIALRGYARSQAEASLDRAWQEAVGPEWSGRTRPVKVTRGVLYVDVQSAALRNELTQFHARTLTTRFQELAPQCKVKSIKFRLAES